MADDLDENWLDETKKSSKSDSKSSGHSDKSHKKKSKSKDRDRDSKEKEDRKNHSEKKDRGEKKHQEKKDVDRKHSEKKDGDKKHSDKKDGERKDNEKKHSVKKDGEKKHGEKKDKESSKRKKDHGSDSDSEPSPKKKRDSDSDSSSSKKKKKKKKESSEEDSGSESEPEQAGTTEELVMALNRQFFGLLTPTEEEEMNIPEKSFCECRQMNESQTDYLAKVVKDWDKNVAAHTRKAAPLVLVICASGIRSVDLKRELSSFLKKAKVAKLFSKHMKVAIKIEEQEKYLKSHVVHFGVGTPHRLKALIELEALSLSHLTHVFVDWNWRDPKKRRMVEVSESRCDLNNLLRQQIIPHLRKHRNVRLGLL